MQTDRITQIIVGVITGVLVAVIVGYFAFYRDFIQLQEQIKIVTSTENAKNKNPLYLSLKSKEDGSMPNIVNVAPVKILDIIKVQQSIFVKKSYGGNANQCFTDTDLNSFIAKGVPNTVAVNLKKSNEFLEVVIAIKEMKAAERQNLLNSARNTYKKTWAELGGISPEGQTDAGQTAEKLIAISVVDLVNNLLGNTKEQIESMMQ